MRVMRVLRVIPFLVVLALAACASLAYGQTWDPESGCWEPEVGERYTYQQTFGVSVQLTAEGEADEVALAWELEAELEVTAVEDGDLSGVRATYRRFALEGDDGATRLSEQRLEGEVVAFTRRSDGSFGWTLLSSEEEHDDDAEFLRYVLAQHAHALARWNALDGQLDPPCPVEVGGRWELGMPAARYLGLVQDVVDLDRSEGWATLEGVERGHATIHVQAEVQTRALPADALVELAYLAGGLEELRALAAAGAWSSGGKLKAQLGVLLPTSGDGTLAEDAELSLRGTLRCEGISVGFEQRVEWEERLTPID